MEKSIFVAIDIGTELIKIISVIYNTETNKITTLLKSTHPSQGFLRGYIVDVAASSRTLLKALVEHQKKTGVEISEAFFSIGGIGLNSKEYRIPHSIAGSEITNFDLSKIKEKSQLIIDKKIPGYLLESQPIRYTIDGFDHYSSPLKMEAKKIYTDYFFLSIPKNHLTSLENIIESNKITPLEITSGILVAGEVIINEEEKKMGCVLINIGSETTSLLVYKNNKPIYISVIPIGARDITLEISKKTKIDFSKAEYIKKKEKISGAIKLAIDNKLKEIAKEIKKHLRDNLKETDQVLTGVILIGGGAKTKGIKRIFKQILSMPVKTNKTALADKDTDFSVAYGLIIGGLKKEKERSNLSLTKMFLPLKRVFRKIFRKMSV